MCLLTSSHYEKTLKQEFYMILQVLSVCTFEKVPDNQLFENKNYKNNTTNSSNQLILFNL